MAGTAMIGTKCLSAQALTRVSRRTGPSLAHRSRHHRVAKIESTVDAKATFRASVPVAGTPGTTTGRLSYTAYHAGSARPARLTVCAAAAAKAAEPAKEAGPDPKKEILAGITVALTFIPETVAFALVCGVSPLVGLYTTIVGAAVTALYGGRPAMLTGAAGALAVVSRHLVQSHGVEYLFACVTLMGVIQLGIGFAKLGKYGALVPKSVVLGFVSGLAVLIGRSQLHEFQIAGGAWLPPDQLLLQAGLVAAGMAIIQLWHRVNDFIPPSLVCILSVTGLVKALGLDVRTVADVSTIAGGLPNFALPQVPFTLEMLSVIWPYALTLAMIGVVESVLVKEIVDENTKTVGNVDQVNCGQGLANLVGGGLLNTMGSCGMIVPSNLNVSSGGRGNLSSLTCAAFIVAAVLAIGPLIGHIPMAALVAVLWTVCLETFAFKDWLSIHKRERSDAAIMVAVTLATVYKDLATAVGLGVVMACVFFALDTQQKLWGTRVVDGDKVTYRVKGPLFFASVQRFKGLFNEKEDADTEAYTQVEVDLREATVLDESAVNAIQQLSERYRAARGVGLVFVGVQDACYTQLQGVDGGAGVSICRVEFN